MRGEGAGVDSTTSTAAELAPRPTIIQRCAKCQSHFRQDFEEAVCPNCVAWAELYLANHAARRAVRR